MKRKEIKIDRRYVATLRQGSRAKDDIYDPEADAWSSYVPDWRRDQFVVKVLDTNAKHQPVKWSSISRQYVKSGAPATGVKVLIQKIGPKHIGTNGEVTWRSAWGQKVKEGDEVVIPAQLIVNTVADNKRLNDLKNKAEIAAKERKDEDEKYVRDLAAKLEKAGLRTYVCYSHGAWRCEITDDPAKVLELIEK